MAIGLLFGSAVLLVVALVVTAVRQHNRRQLERRTALEHVAHEMGWGFHESVDLRSVPGLKRFGLFEQGHRPKLTNLLSSPATHPRTVVFDYAYTISTGKSQQTITQTVCYVTADDLQLPAFSMKPENVMHRFAELFGYRDIDVDGSRDFSERYLLRGADTAAIREAFTADVTSFCVEQERICAAAEGNELIFWRDRRLVAPADVPAFIDHAHDLARRFAVRKR